jgi:hypothetical protein
MTTIKIREEAIPIVKSGLAIFEKRHKMSSEEFIQKFESGDLGDDAEWFDFLFAYRACEHVRKKLKLIEEMPIW